MNISVNPGDRMDAIRDLTSVLRDLDSVQRLVWQPELDEAMINVRDVLKKLLEDI